MEKINRVEVQKTAKGWMVQWYAEKGGRLGAKTLKGRKRAAKFGKRLLTKKGIRSGKVKVRDMAAE